MGTGWEIIITTYHILRPVTISDFRASLNYQFNVAEGSVLEGKLVTSWMRERHLGVVYIT